MSTLKPLHAIEMARLEIYEGRLDAARKLLADIRTGVDVYSFPQVIIELRLARGILNLFCGKWTESADDFQRSEVMARLTGSAEASGFALCWQSHCQFNMGNVVEASELLAKLSDIVLGGRPEFRQRYCQSLAQLLCYGGDLSAARDWFNAARDIAGKLHSRGLFSATLYNHFAMFAWHLMLTIRRSDQGLSRNPLVESMFGDAAVNYDRITGVQNKDFLHMLVRAQIMGCTGKVEDSLATLESLLAENPGLGELELSKVDLERAWSLLLTKDWLKHRGEASKLLERCLKGLVDDDERSLAHHLLAKIAASFGDISEEIRHANMSHDYDVQLGRRRDRVRDTLAASDLPSIVDVVSW